MKKIVFFGCFLSIVCLFADEHIEEAGYYTYYNSNGSLDWDLFYDKWDEIPDSYFIYLNTRRLGRETTPTLWKTVGGLDGMLDPIRRNDVTFTYEKGYISLEIIFSPWNYGNSTDAGWITIGQKRHRYDEAIQQWNFMLNNMK